MTLRGYRRVATAAYLIEREDVFNGLSVVVRSSFGDPTIKTGSLSLIPARS